MAQLNNTYGRFFTCSPSRTSVSMRDMDRPLIGVEGVARPKWAAIDEKVAAANWWQTVRSVPAAVGTVVSLAWRASRGWTVIAGLLHVLSGCVTAFSLLATANVLDQLLTQGPTPERVVHSLPAIALLMGSYSTRAILDALV